MPLGHVFIWGYWRNWFHSIVSNVQMLGFIRRPTYSLVLWPLQPVFLALMKKIRMKPSFISVNLCSAVLSRSQNLNLERKMSLKCKDKMTWDMKWFCNLLRHKFSGFCTPLSSLATLVIPWNCASSLSFILSLFLGCGRGRQVRLLILTSSWYIVS